MRWFQIALFILGTASMIGSAFASGRVLARPVQYRHRPPAHRSRLHAAVPSAKRLRAVRPARSVRHRSGRGPQGTLLGIAGHREDGVWPTGHAERRIGRWLSDAGSSCSLHAEAVTPPVGLAAEVESTPLRGRRPSATAVSQK